MGALQWIGLVYVSGALLMALYQAWRMLFRRDAVEWHYERLGVCFHAVLSTLLWPVVLFVKPGERHTPVGFSIAERKRKLERLDKNPPPCSEVVAYTTTPLDSSGPPTVFRFPAAQLSQAMLPTLQENPRLMNDELGSIYRWLSSHDPNVASPSPVPEAWYFTHVAAEGLEAGLGVADCGLCGKEFGVSELTCHRTQLSRAGGWIFDFWRCPAGHDLLRVEVMHVLLGRSAED